MNRGMKASVRAIVTSRGTAAGDEGATGAAEESARGARKGVEKDRRRAAKRSAIATSVPLLRAAMNVLRRRDEKNLADRSRAQSNSIWTWMPN